MQEPHNALKNDIKVDDVIKGEVQIPEILKTFVSYIIGGPDIRRGNTDIKARRAKSIASDLVFAATSGKKKPSKHLQLGITVKTLTGSRKLIEVLNRLGHCTSYHTVEETETELTFHAHTSENMTPYGMKLRPELGTGIAYDNQDRFVETLSGKNTLHDTVGIAYQTIKVSDQQEITIDFDKNESENNTTEVPSTQKKKEKEENTKPLAQKLSPITKNPE